ncbi:MAG TPA: universal stress protein [Actinomycetaceae bacterium]|nr:universal stress protein [Actinomycetaceae bacterium]
MSNNVILLAMSDTPPAFRAAEVAIRYGRDLGAEVRVITVIPEGEPEVGRFSAHAQGAGRVREVAAAVLKHVTMLGEDAGVAVTGVQRTGRIAAEILAEARRTSPRMIVMAGVDSPGHAIPTIGSHTLRVLEFATTPVLVVPYERPRHHDSRG